MSPTTTETRLTFPLIHLNGNSRESLRDEYINARRDLQKAINSFYAIDFHARNYYPLPPGSWERATAERDEMREALHKVHNYLEQHVEHLNSSPGGIG
jgi:predicted translin family RNA/ssDNA-binding protein